MLTQPNTVALVNTQQLDRILFQQPQFYNNVSRVREDCISLFNFIPTLVPISSNVQRGYSILQMVNLRGTIPISYRQAVYNIPISIQIPESYPFLAPSVFVVPTENMIISPNHGHVDPATGTCYLPYLKTWNPQCNLLQLVRLLQEIFSQVPPVRTKAAPPPYPNSTSQPSYFNIAPSAFPPTKSPYHSSQPQPITPINSINLNNVSPSGSLAFPIYILNPPALPPRPHQPFTGSPPTYGSNVIKPAFDTNAVFEEKNIKNELILKLREKISAVQSDTTREVDTAMLENDSLNVELKSFNDKKNQLIDMKRKTEESIKQNQMKNTEIENWINTNNKNPDEINIDQLTEPEDEIKKQIQHLEAEDYTMEDTLYFLDRALQRGTIDLNTYLKNIRNLSSDQFFKRALILKIRKEVSGI